VKPQQKCLMKESKHRYWRFRTLSGYGPVGRCGPVTVSVAVCTVLQLLLW